MRFCRENRALPAGFCWAVLIKAVQQLPAAHVTLPLLGPALRAVRTRQGRFFRAFSVGMGNSPPTRKMPRFFIFLSRKVSYYCK